MPRHQRLLHAEAFQRVFARATRSSDAYFSVAARPRETPHGPARLGLAVSRKALPRAVHRNRVKRIVRESFRRLHCCDGIDFVVVARHGLRGADNAPVRRSIEAHLALLMERLCTEPHRR
nr:ribonuclease P protein component [uncultured Thiohalocapsa sp.]